MMQTFSQYTAPPEFLTEAKNTHLTHLEDVILDDGPTGVTFALTVLREFGRILNGGSISRSMNVSVKWDGAPAIIFGKDPEDGRFFVATKGAFAKQPKLAKSHADIDAFFQGGLAEKMHLAFDTLGRAGVKGVFQGDCLYSRSTISVQTIDGVTYYAFRPNTITYAVDANSDLGARIAASEFGLVVHTQYTGRGTLAAYSASPVTPQAFSTIRAGSDVVVMDAKFDDLSGTITFTAQESADFELAYEEAASWSRLDSRVYDVILSEPLHGYLQQFINSQIRQNKTYAPEAAFQAFAVFLAEIEDRELASKKTEKGKESVRARFGEMLADMRAIGKSMVNWFALHSAIQRAKTIIVRKLGQASRVASFVSTPTGYKVTGPEGFVAVAHSGKAIKLVDRLEFSRLNFTVPKEWK